jgi:hypothetical protein
MAKRILIIDSHPDPSRGTLRRLDGRLRAAFQVQDHPNQLGE